MYHLPDNLNFNHSSSIVNKYAEDMKPIQCDYYFDSNSWTDPVYESNHRGIIGIRIADSYDFLYGYAISCLSIKRFLCSNLLLQVI